MHELYAYFPKVGARDAGDEPAVPDGVGPFERARRHLRDREVTLRDGLEPHRSEGIERRGHAIDERSGEDGGGDAEKSLTTWVVHDVRAAPRGA